MWKRWCVREKRFQLDFGLYGPSFFVIFKAMDEDRVFTNLEKEATLSIRELDLNEDIKDFYPIRIKMFYYNQNTIFRPLQDVSNSLKQLSRKIDQLQKEFSMLKITAPQLEKTQAKVSPLAQLSDAVFAAAFPEDDIFFY